MHSYRAIPQPHSLAWYGTLRVSLSLTPAFHFTEPPAQQTRKAALICTLLMRCRLLSRLPQRATNLRKSKQRQASIELTPNSRLFSRQIKAKLSGCPFHQPSTVRSLHANTESRSTRQAWPKPSFHRTCAKAEQVSEYRSETSRKPISPPRNRTLLPYK